MDSLEQTLEADMQSLAAEIQKHREQPEMQTIGEQELVKEAIRSFRHENSKIMRTPMPMPAQSTSPLPAYAANASPEVKLEIEYLLDVALKNGLTKALSESKKSPEFVQDAFHDALAGKLYPELQKRGIVK